MGEEKQGIIPKEIETEMKKSYLDYAMSVIVGRALPDVRDGLKPVHRRVLYTMYTTGLLHNRPFKKSANVVGNCMAKYHPHGDSAIYDTLVRMAQPFSLRYTLVNGQGNFGSIDGDNAAAMRYTEAKLQKIAEEILSDIDKETVEFTPNFDGSTDEPTVLPAKLPNLLINGSSGIAVGMATNIPPHNLSEVCEGIAAMLDDPEITVEDLMNYIKGPDFPTGGIILGRSGILNAFRTGRGKVIVRCKHEIEEKANGKKSIIVTEIPYQINKSMLLEQIADLVKEKRIEGITDLRDESDRDGMRIVIELKAGASEDIILNQLYKHSRLQETFGVNTLALVDSTPMTLDIASMLRNFITHRKVVVTKRTEYELRQAEEKAHILEGLMIALKYIDEIIEKIKKSRDPEEAAGVLRKDYDLSEKQAKVILEMRLQRLSSMEREKIKTDYDDTITLIKRLKEILADDQEIINIIKEETADLKQRYGDERRTQIAEHLDIDIDVEDLIEKEDMIVTVTHRGYVKRVPIDTYKEQRRGGKGVIASGKKEEDFIESVFVANTHSYLLCFTDKGRLHWIKVYRLPQASRQAQGSAIVNFLELLQDEKVTAIVPIDTFDNQYIIMTTAKGIIKRVDAALFSNTRRTGIIAVSLEEGDRLIKAMVTDGKQTILLATKNGKAVRFDENDIRPMGRSARGVMGIRMQSDDCLIGMVLAPEDTSIFTVTENGFGKRTKASEYRHIRRGGSGVKNIITNDRNGGVIAIKSVAPEDGIVLISQKGFAIRTRAGDVSEIGRNTQGVRLMRINDDDKVVACAKVVQDEQEDEVRSDNE
ncbi:DNA gyrase subunit A [Candidatus Woesearchaeota archaeon]|nr:DNA gyrase subunit A [Candidatus Woesearchaeota archaeon]